MPNFMRRRYVSDDSVEPREVISSQRTLQSNEELRYFELAPGGSIVVAGNNVLIEDGIGVVSSAGHFIRTSGNITDLTIRTVSATTAPGGDSNRFLNLENVQGTIALENLTFDGSGSATSSIVILPVADTVVYVSNTNVENSGGIGLAVQVAANSSTGLVTSNISDSTFTGSSSHGAQFANARGRSIVNITNSEFSSNLAGGLNLIASSQAVSLRANLISVDVEQNQDAGLFMSQDVVTDSNFIFSVRARQLSLVGNNAAALSSSADFVVDTVTNPAFFSFNISNSTLGVVRVANGVLRLFNEGAQNLATTNTVTSATYPTPNPNVQVPDDFYLVDDADVREYIRLISNGILALSSVTLQAITALITAGKSEGWFDSSLQYLALFTGLTDQALKTAFVSQSTNNEIVFTGDYTIAEDFGAQPNSVNSSNQANTGVSIADSPEDTIAIWIYSLSTANNYPTIIGNSSTHYLGIQNASGVEADILFSEVGDGNNTRFNPLIPGCVQGSQGDAGLTIRRNSIIGRQRGRETATVLTADFYRYWVYNEAGDWPSDIRVGVTAIWNKELSDAESLSFFNATQTFNTVIGRV